MLNLPVKCGERGEVKGIDWMLHQKNVFSIKEDSVVGIKTEKQN